MPDANKQVWVTFLSIYMTDQQQVPATLPLHRTAYLLFSSCSSLVASLLYSPARPAAYHRRTARHLWRAQVEVTAMRRKEVPMGVPRQKNIRAKPAQGALRAAGAHAAACAVLGHARCSVLGGARWVVAWLGSQWRCGGDVMWCGGGRCSGAKQSSTAVSAAVRLHSPS